MTKLPAHAGIRLLAAAFITALSGFLPAAFAQPPLHALAFSTTAQDEGDGNDCQPNRRQADQQHGRAHNSGRAERCQSHPMPDSPFG